MLAACPGPGGAIYMTGSASSSGNMVFQGCRSSDGGPIHVSFSKLLDARCFLARVCGTCSAGGAALILGSLLQSDGTMSFDACAAVKGGPFASILVASC